MADVIVTENINLTTKATPVLADRLLLIDSETNPNSLNDVELSAMYASSSETTTGTDAVKAITPDGLAGSEYGKEIVELLVFASATNCSTGDAKTFFRIPAKLNGWNLVGVAMVCYTAGTTNTMDVQIRNKTDAVDMLSTKLKIDSGETDSSTATAAVIDTTKDDVATGDVIAVDVDAVHTTPAQGLVVELTFQLP